nr:uncharacterized protein LOC129268434 [Lytechinus pictus]
MVRKGQVHARQLPHFIGVGLADDQQQQEQEQELHVEGGLQDSMEHRDGGTRQLAHETQPYHGDENLLRRSYGGFGVNMHAQGIPLGYRPGEEVPQREDPRNVIHRPYEQREVVNVHQPVEPMRWSREEEPGYEESNKQLAVAQMMAEMHQGNMLQQRSSNLMMMASQMGQGRYHPDFLQTGGRMLFGAPPPRVSTEERFPYQTEMMRQNQAMMFGMAPPALEKGRFEELFQQQRGMMMDMAARGIGDSRMQEFYLGRGGMVDPSPRETVHSRNHVDFGHPRVGMMMGMSHDGWRGPAENVESGESEDIRHEVPLDAIDTSHLKVESHVTEPSREHFIDRPTLPHTAEHSPDSTPNMNFIQPNHTFTSEAIVNERSVPRNPETVGTVSNNLPLPSVGSLGVRDTVAEMVMEMERRDREKMRDMSGSEESSSSEQSDSDSEAEDADGNKQKHQSIPTQVSPCEVDETSKVLHPERHVKLPQDSYSQDSGSESDESSVAHDHEKNPSSGSSQDEAESPIPSPAYPLPAPIRSMKAKLMAAVRQDLKEEAISADSQNHQNSDVSSDEKHDREEDAEESADDELNSKHPANHQQNLPSTPQHDSIDSDASSHPDNHDIKSVRMPMWRWIGPKQSRSTRVTRQSAKKGNLTIRLVKRKQPPKKRGRRKAVAVPITKESFPTAVPCAHPTSKRRGKVFQKVVMEDMVVMDGQIMTVNKRGRPRKIMTEGELPRKVNKRGRQKRVKSEDSGPPKKRGRPRKEPSEKEPVKKVKRVRSKSALPRNVKLISIPAPEKITSEKDSEEKKSSNVGHGGKDFGCPFCGKEFKCGFRLNKHMQTHIPKEVLEQNDQGTIQMQLALSPDREKRMVRFDQCQFCKQLFMDLKAHIRRVHSEAEEHLCSICGHVLRNKESLVAHEKRHKVVAAGKKEFVCKDCGADFFFQTGLNQHSKRHLSERACVCDVCGKAFKTTKDLEKHKLVHTKPHSCPVCKRRFGQKSNMKAHMRQHSGDKPFRCDLCSASFTHNVSLKTHKKNTHGIDWWKENGKKEEPDEKMEKMAIMNACLDYFGNTGGGNGPKWDPPAPPPNPNPNPNPTPNPINPLHPINPINPLNTINHFTPINHSQVNEGNNDHAPMHLPHFTPLNSLSAMHPDTRPHPMEDIKPIV